MGLSMCGHLLENGYKTSVYNRTKKKASPLLKKGAEWLRLRERSPGKVGRRVHDRRVSGGREEVYFGPDGLLAGLGKGGVTVDMTTTEPSRSRSRYMKMPPGSLE
ncbi:MAG: NAD(P)-binding domain-containing protein [Thermodesulfobacteriota bacterium]